MNFRLLLSWVAGVGAMTICASASAHDAKTDASGCHGRDLSGLEHCHVESVALQQSESTALNLGDARRGARELRLPDCLTCAEVAALQLKLAELGHSPGPIDGIIGPRTRAAIKSYQRAQGLAVDGYASQALLARIGVAK